MPSLVCATGHITDPVPLIDKRRGLSPGGRFPPSLLGPQSEGEVILTLNKKGGNDCVGASVKG